MTNDAPQLSGRDVAPLLRVLRGLFAGALLAGMVTLARRAGILSGGLGLGAAVFGMLCLPVSRILSRRILIAGIATLGWLPMEWWLPQFSPSVGRVTIQLALLYGGLGAWVASGRAPLNRLSRLRPTVRWVDGLPIVAALASAVNLRTFLAARSGVRVLTLLIPGWDHSAHFAIVELIRKFGVVTTVAPALDLGGPTSYTGYPQGYHAAVAATMELLTSPTVGRPELELVAYAHAMAIIVILGVTAVTAGICALPSLRRRPALAAPMVALVTAAFVAGPGMTALLDGFPNFVFACALLAAIPLLVVPVDRVVTPMVLFACAGAMVGIAHSWALLLAPGALAGLPLLLPLSRRRWAASRRQSLTAVGILIAAIASLASALKALSSVDLSAQLVAPGSVTPPAVGLLLAVVVGSAGLSLALLASVWTKSRRSRGAVVRAAGLTLVPIGGTLAAATIVVMQLRATHVISYYFWKFAIALELLCIVVGVLTAVTMLASRPLVRLRLNQRIVVLGSSALLAAAASQAFGYAGPTLAAYGVWQGDPTTQYREGVRAQAAVPNPTAERLLAAAHVQQEDPWRHVLFLPFPADGRTHPMSAEQWYQALTGTWNDTRAAEVHSLDCLGSSATDAGACSTNFLKGDPLRVVTVDPDVIDSVRAAVDPSVRDRVIAW